MKHFLLIDGYNITILSISVNESHRLILDLDLESIILALYEVTWL